MKVISAVNNQRVQDSLKEKYPDLEFLLGDLNYQEGILDSLKQTNPDALIISPDIEGAMDRHGFISAIRELNQTVRILLVVREADTEFKNWLAFKGVYDIFIDGACSFSDIYDALNRKQDVIVRIEKEIIEKERVVTKEKLVGFKKLVLTVWDNAEFGCELAYVTAKLTKYRVLLADLDLLSPKADLFLNVPKSPGGFKMAVDCIDRRCLSSSILYETAQRRRELDNLFILTGSYSLENYEYYRKEHLAELIDRAYQAFDVTILLVNKSIYDMFTCISLIKSDYNIIAVRADKDVIREFNSYLVFLKDKQHIPLEKNKFVAFDYDAGTSLSESVLHEITQGNYLGKVQRSRKREIYRNLKPPFARRLDGKSLDDYAKLLSPFVIFPRKRLAERLYAIKRRCKKQCRQFRRIMKRWLTLAKRPATI